MANRDAFPNIDEHGPGSAHTPSGMAIGCAVCSTANILVRFNKPIPRLSSGAPNMGTLGARMGARCRRVNNTQHGTGLFSNTGKAWASCCVYLELRANGIAARHGNFSKAQIASFIKARKPLIVPGMYGRVPRVSPSSYSSTKPAYGRSDSFTGAHMVDAWAPQSVWSDGSLRQVIISDSDFGSGSRPVVPPHSIWSAGTFWSYQQSLNWKLVVVDSKLPSLSTSSPATGTRRVKVTCDTVVRRGASIQSDKLGSLAKGDILTVTATTPGGHWSGCGKSGEKWVRFTHKNGKSTRDLYNGRAYAYAASGLTQGI